MEYESGPDRAEALQKYAELAPVYDRRSRLGAQIRRLVVKRLQLEPGETVLDVACGTGLAFGLLEAGIGAEGRVVGIDLSGDMLAVARARVQGAGWPNVTLIEASAEEAEIPFQVDAAISVLTHDVMR